MLNTLLESRAAQQRLPAAQVTSVLAHAALITAAVLATRQVTAPVSIEPAHAVTFVAPVAAPSPPAARSINLLRGFQLVVPPVAIPDVLPPIDLTRRLTNPSDYTGVGVPGGSPDGTYPDSVNALPESVVDTPARLVPGSASPAYPELLRAAGLGGDVQTTFVIDSTGRPDMRTFRILSSTHPRFAESVTRAVASARFVPAEFGGRKVRQWVRMPFVFSIR